MSLTLKLTTLDLIMRKLREISMVSNRLRLLLCAVVLAGCLCCPVLAQNKAMIRAGEGIGPIHVYQTKEEVVKKVGRPNEVHDYPMQLVWIYYAPYYNDSTKIQIIFEKAANQPPRVSSVTISGAKGIFTTPEGVTLGMSAAEATARLGEKKHVQSAELQYKGNPGLMVLSIRKGRVDKIQCHVNDTSVRRPAAAANRQTAANKANTETAVKSKAAANSKAASKSKKTGADKAAAAAPRGRVIRPGVGVGAVAFGMTREEVARAAGKPSKTSRSGDIASYWFYDIGDAKVNVQFVVDHNTKIQKVKCIMVNDRRGLDAPPVKSNLATPEGVTLGTPVETVIAKLGKGRQHIGSGSSYPHQIDYPGLQVNITAGRVRSLYVTHK